MYFERDEDLLVSNQPHGLPNLFFEKGEEVHVKSYREDTLGTDMWVVTLLDGTEFPVMKESVEFEDISLT